MRVGERADLWVAQKACVLVWPMVVEKVETTAALWDSSSAATKAALKAASKVAL